MADGNIIALREPVMPNVPLTANPLKTGKYVLNVESVGLTPEQFFRLCRDNPEGRFELMAQKQMMLILNCPASHWT